MSDSVMWSGDKPLIFALFAVALALLLNLAAYGTPECAPAQSAPTTQDTSHNSNAGTGIGVVVYWPLCVVGRTVSRHKDVINALSTLVIAAFTFALFFATYGQLSHLRRDFNATHRPHLKVHSVAFRSPVLNDNSDLDLIGARVVYANVGDQDAVVVSINFVFRHSRLPLDNDIFLREVVEPPREPIGGGFHGWFEINSGWDVRMVRLADDAHAPYFLLGRIVYRSPQGRNREVGFCRRLVHTPQRNRWEVDENPEYEYSY